MSDQKINVTFRAVDSGLAAYIADIQRKADQLTNSSIKGAISQSDQAKSQLRIINETITALERKSRIENQAYRQVISNQRDVALSTSRQNFVGKREGVYNDLRAGKINEAGAKEKLNVLSGVERDSEDRIKNNYRENLSSVKENERQSKLQTSLAKESLEALRQTAKDNVKAILSGDKSLESVISKASTDEERLVAGLTKEELARAKGKEEPGKPRNELFNSILAVENLARVTTAGANLFSSKNGFDALPQLGEMAGTLLGLIGGEAGARVGGIVGKEAAEFLKDRALSKEEFAKATNRYNATTGGDPFSPDTSRIGVRFTDFVGIQTDIAKRRGYGAGSAETARDSLYAEKGYGISQGSSDGLIEIQRSAKANNRDLAGLIGAIIENSQGNILKNGDRAFADELIGKFTSLTKELLKTSESVPTGLPMDILSRFNSVGGAFAARDPRSGGYINSIQGALSAPGSDNIRALAFRVLSQQNPNAGIFDLRESMQGGLNSPGYLRGMLSYIDRLGGGDQMGMSNLSGLFPGLPLSAVRRLYNNRSGLMNGNLSVNELKAKFPLDFQGAAEAHTNILEKSTADIENSKLKDIFDTAGSLGAAITSAIKESLHGSVIEMKNGRMVLTSSIKQNVTIKPKGYYKDHKVTRGGMDRESEH